jgi:hypothetical protein
MVGFSTRLNYKRGFYQVRGPSASHRAMGVISPIGLGPYIFHLTPFPSQLTLNLEP